MVVEAVTTEDHWGGVAIMTDLFLILIMMTAGIYTQEIASVSSCWLFKARWYEEKWMKSTQNFLVIFVTFYEYNHYFKIN